MHAALLLRREARPRREAAAQATRDLCERVDVFGIDLRRQPAPITLRPLVAIERELIPDEARLIGAAWEADDFGEALTRFSGSQNDFDLWFKQRLADSTGIDLNSPPEMTLPELLSSYSSEIAVA